MIQNDKIQKYSKTKNLNKKLKIFKSLKDIT